MSIPRPVLLLHYLLRVSVERCGKFLESPVPDSAFARIRASPVDGRAIHMHTPMLIPVIRILLQEETSRTTTLSRSLVTRHPICVER